MSAELTYIYPAVVTDRVGLIEALRICKAKKDEDEVLAGVVILTSFNVGWYRGIIQIDFTDKEVSCFGKDNNENYLNMLRLVTLEQHYFPPPFSYTTDNLDASEFNKAFAEYQKQAKAQEAKELLAVSLPKPKSFRDSYSYKILFKGRHGKKTLPLGIVSIVSLGLFIGLSIALFPFIGPASLGVGMGAVFLFGLAVVAVAKIIKYINKKKQERTNRVLKKSEFSNDDVGVKAEIKSSPRKVQQNLAKEMDTESLHSDSAKMGASESGSELDQDSDETSELDLALVHQFNGVRQEFRAGRYHSAMKLFAELCGQIPDIDDNDMIQRAASIIKIAGLTEFDLLMSAELSKAFGYTVSYSHSAITLNQAVEYVLMKTPDYVVPKNKSIVVELFNLEKKFNLLIQGKTKPTQSLIEPLKKQYLVLFKKAISPDSTYVSLAKQLAIRSDLLDYQTSKKEDGTTRERQEIMRMLSGDALATLELRYKINKPRNPDAITENINLDDVVKYLIVNPEQVSFFLSAKFQFKSRLAEHPEHVIKMISDSESSSRLRMAIRDSNVLSLEVLNLYLENAVRSEVTILIEKPSLMRYKIKDSDFQEELELYPEEKMRLLGVFPAGSESIKAKDYRF